MYPLKHTSLLQVGMRREKPVDFFFKINLFIYLFWLHWVSVAVRGLPLELQRAGATLCCGARASHCGGFSCCGAQASHCGGFSCCGARALGARASVTVARRLSSCGRRALERKLSSCGSRALEHSLSSCGAWA